MIPRYTSRYKRRKITGERFQMDLNAVSAWSRTWLLQFNVAKCVVISIKHKTDYKYSLALISRFNGIYLYI